MDNQLPAYTPAAPGVSVFHYNSNLPSNLDASKGDLVFNEERTHRLVSQVFGRILAFLLYVISAVMSIVHLLLVFREGFKCFILFIGYCFFWFFFHKAYYEPEHLSGNPETKKFYPILVATALIFPTYLSIFSCWKLLEIIICFGIWVSVVVCFYFMYMGNDFRGSWFLFCKPWRYRKLLNKNHLPKFFI
jgi:hypothetical protein